MRLPKSIGTECTLPLCTRSSLALALRQESCLYSVSHSRPLSLSLSLSVSVVICCCTCPASSPCSCLCLLWLSKHVQLAACGGASALCLCALALQICRPFSDLFTAQSGGLAVVDRVRNTPSAIAEWEQAATAHHGFNVTSSDVGQLQVPWSRP